MLLLELGMKGPGYFNRNTFILQLKLSIFLSGWLGKEKSVTLCLLKAREEYPLAEGSYDVVSMLPFLRYRFQTAELHVLISRNAFNYNCC